MSNTKPIDDIQLRDVLPTKFSIDLMADTIAEEVRQGRTEPLTVAVKMTALESLVKAVREKIQPEVMDELGKHPMGKAEILGAAVSLFDSVKYDYYDVPGWRELDEQIRDLTEKRKAIEDREKKWRRGELPVLSATSTFKIQLAK